MPNERDHPEEGIYIEFKPIPGATAAIGYLHSYLVHRDGKGNERVIRGGPEKKEFGLLGGDIGWEVDVPLRNSKDKYGPGETAVSRRSYKLDLEGRNSAEVWSDMAEEAKRLQDLGLDYNMVREDQNSNSVTRAMLRAGGIDPEKTLPPAVQRDDLPGFENDLSNPYPRYGRSVYRDDPEADIVPRPRRMQDDIAEKGVPENPQEATDFIGRTWRGGAEKPPQAPQSPAASGAAPAAETRGAAPPAPKDAAAEDSAAEEHAAASAPSAAKSLDRENFGPEALSHEAKTLEAAILAPGKPFEVALSKPVERWTESDLRAAMTARMDLPDHDPRRDELVGKERAYFSHFYGDGPARLDATGRMIDPAPKRPLPREPAPPGLAYSFLRKMPARYAPGEDRRSAITKLPVRYDDPKGPAITELGRQAPAVPQGPDPLPGLNRMAATMAGLAHRDGGPVAVKRLQTGLNLLNGAGFPGTNHVQTLKADGLFGPRTKGALHRALAKTGPAKLHEGLALGGLSEMARAARETVARPQSLNQGFESAFTPLFRDPTASSAPGPAPEKIGFQEALNDIGAKTFGPRDWTPLKLDGAIGPKTAAGFTRLAKTLEPDVLSHGVGSFFGFL